MIALLTGLLLSTGAFAQQEPATDVAEVPKKRFERPGMGWGALPAVNYNSDEGFGAGAVVSLYRYDGETDPYKWKTTGLLFLTTLGVHSHFIDLDVLELGDADKIRVTSRVKFAASRAENYCGVGSRVTCDPLVATEAADEAIAAGDITEADREVFERRYFKNRLLEPFWTTNVRYKLRDKPHRVEIIGGYRFNWLMSGDLAEKGPYPGSLYSRTYFDGENARHGVLQTGLMADNRDNEPSPHKGYWVEGTVRGSHPFLGSSPNLAYVGFNTNLRGYLPLVPEGKLTFANRLVVDGIVGNASTQELTWFGGTQILQGIGGLNAGRGVRQRRYRGPIKAFEQAELRWRLFTLDVGFPIELYMLGFGEISYASDAPRNPDSLAPVDPDASPFHLGEGGGFRVVVDKNFIVRIDMGFASDEDFAMGLYIDLDNLF